MVIAVTALPLQILRAQESVKRSELNLAALWRARQAAQAKGEAEAGTKQAGWMDKVVASIIDNLQVRTPLGAQSLRFLRYQYDIRALLW